MRLFWELIKLSFQRQLTYRAANIAGLLTNAFFGILRSSVMIALFGARGEVVGMTLQQAITYTGITQALIGYLTIFRWLDLMHSVYSGEVGADMLKPMGLFQLWLGRDVGRATAQLLMRGLPIMLIYALLYDVNYPATITQWIGLLASLPLGLLISFSWRFLLNGAAFWTPNALGIVRMGTAVLWILSGFLMPLRFFPDWVQTFCYWTPFPSMMYMSMEIYVGLLDGWAMVEAIAIQALWAMGMILGCQLLLRAGMKRLVILGG
ncbi:MAG: ABC-2 family transporter protein [Chloroflexota bacterium]